MKRWKKYTSPLMALVLCVGLTACGGGNSNNSNNNSNNNNSNNLDNSVVGKDWRTTGVVSDIGIIARNGEDTAVQVCVDASNTTFYYDKEEQVMFDSVEYPLTLESDAGEAFQSIDFADLNNDGNSDVTMKFNDGGSDLRMVWFWDTESNLFAYQPEESQIGVENEGIAVPVLMSSGLPFTNMNNLQSENHEDGTYYYSDATEDGMTIVVNTVVQNHMGDEQTPEEYLTDCAVDLSETDNYQLQSIEQNDATSI